MDLDIRLGLDLEPSSSQPNWIKYDSVIGELFRELHFLEHSHEFRKYCNTECYGWAIHEEKSRELFDRLGPELWPADYNPLLAWWLLDAASSGQPVCPKDLYYHNIKDQETHVSS